MQLYGNSGAIWITEDNCFAKGGEGELYNIVGFNDYVAKIYKEGLLTATRQEKLIYMSSLYSGDRMQQLAWPKDILKDPYGNVKGFVMRRFSATRDLADLLDGTSNNSSNNLDWLKRIVIALNLAHLVNEIHLMNQVIGDMNPKNFGVDMGNGFACAFDTDSFHLRNKSTGKWYPCTVLDEHYIAPEFQARLNQGGRVDSFRPEETFTRETDNFALAVLIFQLLFNGVHPFTAARVPSRGSSVVIHTRETNIYQRMSPFFNPAPNTTIPVYAPPLSIIPENMQQMFKQAFLQDTRPTAQQWASVLSSLLLQTDKCTKGHYFGRYNTKCPWCELEEKKKQATAASVINAPVTSSPSSGPASHQPPAASSVPNTPRVNIPVTPAKRNSSWKYILPVIAIFIIIIIISSGGNKNTQHTTKSNSTYSSVSGYTSANNQSSQKAKTVVYTAKPTNKPTNKPTAKPTPTATPFTESMKFDSKFKINDGVVRISWTKSYWPGPYTVKYQIINNSSSVEQTRFNLGTTEKTHLDCPYFIPGEKYNIILSSSNSRISGTYKCPSASTFSDGKLQASAIKFSLSPRSISSSAIKNGKWASTKSCKFSAKAMESDIRSDKNHYGLYTKISYPTLAYNRTYQTLFAYYAPNGYVDSFLQVVTYESQYPYIYWDIYANEFFDRLYEKCGKIPTGKYTVKLFLNGEYVTSQTFNVNK